MLRFCFVFGFGFYPPSLKMLNVDLVFVDGLALLAFSGNMKTRYGP